MNETWNEIIASGINLNDTNYFRDVIIEIPLEKNKTREKRRQINHAKEVEKRDAIILKKSRGKSRNWKMGLSEAY